MFAVERNQESGYAQQWNLSFQKTFGSDWSAEVGYLGSKLTNLGVPDVNLNQLTTEQLAIGLTNRVADRAGSESVFWSDSGIILARRPDDRAPTTSAAVSRALQPLLLSQQRRPLDLSFNSVAPGASFFRRHDFHALPTPSQS